MVDICEFEIRGIKLVVPKRFNHLRGYFSEAWSDRVFRREITDVTFVLDNQSGSAKKRTLRGIHFQSRLTQGITYFSYVMRIAALPISAWLYLQFPEEAGLSYAVGKLAPSGLA